MDKRRASLPRFGKYLVNPIVKAALALRLAPPSYAILEQPAASLACPDGLRSETGLTTTSSGWLPSTATTRTTSKPTRGYV
jgi:hypothetical protein